MAELIFKLIIASRPAAAQTQKWGKLERRR
jgi:hypothetical protein